MLHECNIHILVGLSQSHVETSCDGDSILARTLKLFREVAFTLPMAHIVVHRIVVSAVSVAQTSTFASQSKKDTVEHGNCTVASFWLSLLESRAAT